MPYTNPFFSSTTGYQSEVNLIDDLVTEQIGMYGVDILYMPRHMLNLDTLLHESSKVAFEIALPMPMYIKTFDGYDNGMELLTKFGVRSADQLTLQLSRTQFETFYSPFLEQYYKSINGNEELNRLEGEIDARPKEGDLIYFPFDDGIFEIKYVMFDQPFFQLGQGYIFEIRCEKFEYSGERFSTGYEDVDDTPSTTDFFKTEFTMKDGGSFTFQNQERVTIYDVSDLETEGLLDLMTETGDNIGADGLNFRLYNSSGFLYGVPSVKATVMEWDRPNLKLTLGDFTEMDPEQKDPTDADVDVSKFDSVMIVGDTSNAVWYSTDAVDKDQPFDDGKTIQTEYDDIKIEDPADTNPFGFV